MYCSNCGSPVEAGESFCPQCGAPVEVPQQMMDQQQYQQPYYPQEPVYMQAPVPPQPPRKNVRSVVIGSIAGVLCAAVAVGGIFAVVAHPWQKKLTTAQAFREYGELLLNSKNEIGSFASEHEVPPVAVYDINGSGIEDLVFVEKDSQSNAVRVCIAVDSDGRIVRNTTDNAEHFVLFTNRSDGSLYRYTIIDNTETFSRLVPEDGSTAEKFVCVFDDSSGSASYAYYPDGKTESGNADDAKRQYDQLIDRLNTSDKDIIVSDRTLDEIDDLFRDKKDIASTSYDDAVDLIGGEDSDSGNDPTTPSDKNDTDTASSDERKQETEEPTQARPTEAVEVYGEFAGNYIFTSGAGAWGSSIELKSDGSFTGSFHDSNMGESGYGYQSTMYVSEFSGSFKNPKKINDHTYYFELADISYERNPGDREIRDDGNDHYTLLIYSEAYGLDKADKGIYAYTADASWSELPEGFRQWSDGLIGSSIENDRLGRKCLYVIEPKYPWFGEKEKAGD